MKNWKRLTALMLVAVLSVFMLTACGGSQTDNSGSQTNNSGSQADDSNAADDSAAPSEDDSSSTGEGGTLKVGMEIGYPPMEYKDDDGVTPIGVDVELAYALGEELGMEVELIDTAWDGIFAGLAKKDYDCIISSVTITPERLLDFDFTDPYIENWQCIVTLADASVKPQNIDELAGLKVCYQESTTSDEYVTNHFQNADNAPEVFEYAKVMNCFDELKLGRVDAVVVDSIVASSYIGDGTYEVTWSQQDVGGETAEQFAVCCPKGDEEFLNKMNDAMAKVKESGKLKEILDKYSIPQ